MPSCSFSSDDDLEGLIQGAVSCYQQRIKHDDGKTDQEDEFEKEMNASVTRKIDSIQNEAASK